MGTWCTCLRVGEILCDFYYIFWCLFFDFTAIFGPNSIICVFADGERSLPQLRRNWTLVPRRLLDLVSSLLSLFEQPSSCISVIGIGDELGTCLISTLPGALRPSDVNTVVSEEFEKCLELPTAQIIERHDICSILDYLVMKLRSALDRDWLQTLATLLKVISFSFHSFRDCRI